MAKFDQLIPFILQRETSVTKAQMGNSLEQAIEAAKKRGFAKDPHDRGGATQCGITIGTYRTYCARKGYPAPSEHTLRNIPASHWYDCANALFWQRWKGDQIQNQAIANMLVDWLWHSGNPGIRVPQQILGVKADCIVGPKTLAAINNHPNPENLFNLLKTARLRYVEGIVARDPSQARYLNGWRNRINAITYNGLKLD